MNFLSLCKFLEKSTASGVQYPEEITDLNKETTEIKSTSDKIFSEVQIQIKPDGAIARFRAFGNYHMPLSLLKVS